ncbi:hypothetical protein [Streptomyces dysideae]|uniref:Mercury transporter n=1 Tax=Streptomyces dysideae TaxID=909626 RepID=A0A117RXW9_9ACTN|nr:hypothetical protein [Streptomyces dysideae]KUO14541.1 hypothetical protein AQJ91_46320 [Streptomyces dysideae]
MGVLVGLAAVVRAVWCCAGPLAVGGVGVSVTGGALENAWLVTVGTVIVLIGVGHARRRRGLAGPDDCCLDLDVRAEEVAAEPHAG